LSNKSNCQDIFKVQGKCVVWSLS